MSNAGLIPNQVAQSGFIPVQATVQMDDIVSVRVSNVENALVTLFETTKAKLTEANKDLSSAQEKFRKALKAEVKNQDFSEIEDLRKALKEAGCKGAIVHLGDTFCLRDGKLSITAKLMEESRYSPITWEIVRPEPRDVKEIRLEVDARQKEVVKLNEELAKLLQARGKLGSVERTARAAVAKQRLSQTDQGKKILNELDGTDPSAMLGLPAGTIKI